MAEKDRSQWLYIGLIAIGGFLFLSNLGWIPRLAFRSWQVLWPLALIAVGLYWLLSAKDQKVNVQWHGGEDEPVRVHVGEKEYFVESPVAKTVLGVVGAAIAITVVGLVLFGVVGPVLLVVLGAVGLALLIALGIPFLALLLPFLILASPVLLVLWLLRILF